MKVVDLHGIVAKTFGLSVRDTVDNPGRVVVDEID